MTEQELRDAYGLTRHERRQYDDGVACSCGKEWNHDKPHQHTPADPEPGCEYCEEAAK